MVAQTWASNPFDGNIYYHGVDVGDSSAPAAVDWDGDGQPIVFTLTASDAFCNPICTQIQNIHFNRITCVEEVVRKIYPFFQGKGHY